MCHTSSKNFHISSFNILHLEGMGLLYFMHILGGGVPIEKFVDLEWNVKVIRSHFNDDGVSLSVYVILLL